MTTTTVRVPARHAFTAFGGARCEILLADGSAAEIAAQVAEVYEFEAQLSRFRSSSELSRFNAGAGERVVVTPLLESLLRSALDAWELSDGLVNAATGAAVIAAGYDRSIEAVRRKPGPMGAPSPVAPLPDVLEVGHGWAQLRRGFSIDLGGIGKGWLADHLCARYDNAVVNLGGDLRARGDGILGEGWILELCDGRRFAITDGGAATSGIAGRRWSGGHHLIDPRTGAPALTDIQAVSVVATSALTAEVFAKGAAILGSAGAGDWLSQRGATCHAVMTESSA